MSNRRKLNLVKLARVLGTDLQRTYGDGRTEAQEHADDSRMIAEGIKAAFPPDRGGEYGPEAAYPVTPGESPRR